MPRKPARAKRAAEAPIKVLCLALDDASLQRLAQASKRLQLCVCANDEAALEQAADAEVSLGFGGPELFARAPRLKWLHFWSAGVDGKLDGVPPGVKVTCSRGVYGPQLAEHALALLLALTRQLTAKELDVDRLTTLEGKRMLIIGMGGSGTALAAKAKALGMKVDAAKRERGPLRAQLGKADVVVSCVPLTEKTKHLLGHAELLSMKPGARLINISRGAVVDTAALTDALKSGHLAGAGLDVTEPEPLPDDHPLRALDNVVLTPHSAGTADVATEATVALAAENLRRYVAKKALLNVVDLSRGY
jgi:phosphoglycerate dehydrogenase-like enzyme